MYKATVNKTKGRKREQQIIVGIFFFFYWPHPWHMEVPRLGVELELQLPTYATATAMQDLSHTSVTYTTAQDNAGSPTQ